jgi:hypothetical protein
MATSFVGVMQKLNTPDQFLLFTTKGGRVTGGTQDTLRLVGSGVDLEDTVVPLSRFVDDDTRGGLLQAAGHAFTKSGGTRLMKSMQVGGGREGGRAGGREGGLSPFFTPRSLP